MKNMTLPVFFSCLFLSVCGILSAQQTAGTSLTCGPQAVTNHAVNNPDVLVVTGKIVDGSTNKAIANAKINFDNFGEELLQASIDDQGNYAIALSKKELGEPVRIVFRVPGYKRYVIKKIDKDATYIDADVFLQPTLSEEKSQAKLKFVMNEDPFNTMVIKLQ